MRQTILDDVLRIEPFDKIETTHRQDVICWIQSGVELCRLEKPATPPKHLVSYFVLADGRHFLLVEHRNAGLWLPTGGHVEPGESPNEAASREAKEELGIDAQFLSKHPLFITSAETVGKTAGHTDVSLWFVILHSRAQQLQFDKSEFRSIQWFHRDDLPLDQSDPNMGRFVEKLLNCPDFR